MKFNSLRSLALCFLAAVTVSAQVGSYDPNARQIMPGTVREIKDNTFTITLQDMRIVTVKVTPYTAFNDGLSVRTLQGGYRVLVKGNQGRDGILTATEISLDGQAMTKDATEARNQTVSKAPPTPAQVPRAESAPARRPVSSDDDGPPVLRRGKPAPRPDTTAADDSAPVQTASNSQPVLRTAPAPVDNTPQDSSLHGVRDRAAPEAPPGGYGDVTPVYRPTNLSPKEELLERAREWALSFSQNLPNYVCQQYTTRYLRVPGNREWQAQDVVSANVVYENGKEDYRNIAINGRPVNKKMEELPGSWSTGEFGTTLLSLFHPGRHAEFTYVKQTYINGMTASVYDYKVRREDSDWHVSLGSQSIIPAYNGRVWIEQKTAQVLRIEMSATNIPRDFPLDQVEASNDYGFVRLATADEYMLPTHAETLSCERGSPNCSRNTIDFRNYHKYTGDANIIFDK